MQVDNSLPVTPIARTSVDTTTVVRVWKQPGGDQKHRVDQTEYIVVTYDNRGRESTWTNVRSISRLV